MAKIEDKMERENNRICFGSVITIDNYFGLRPASATSHNTVCLSNYLLNSVWLFSIYLNHSKEIPKDSPPTVNCVNLLFSVG